MNQTPSPLPSLAQAPTLAQLPPALPAGAPLEVLLVRAKELGDMLSNLQGERSALTRLVRNAPQGSRAEIQQQITQLDIQISRVQTSLRSVRQDVMSRVPQNVVTSTGQYVVAGRGNNSGFTGDHVTGIMIVFTLAVLMPIALGITRRLWRRGSTAAAPASQDVVSPRLDRLEQAVDAVAIEIERISEGQRFVTKVMTERPAAGVRGASVPEANESSALGEPKPFLALGAGPMEPVPVAQRQAVRQSITPH